MKQMFKENIRLDFCKSCNTMLALIKSKHKKLHNRLINQLIALCVDENKMH